MNPSVSSQRTVTKYQTFTTKDFPTLDDSSGYVIKKTFSSTQPEELQEDGSEARTVVTTKTIKTADGKTITTTVTKTSALPEEFSRKLCVTRQQQPTESKVTVIKKSYETPPKRTVITKCPSPTPGPQIESVTSLPSKEEEDFMKECLDSHNKYRKKHGCPPIKISIELWRYATAWVSYLAKEDKFQHRMDGKYGENIFMKWSSDPNCKIDGTLPVESWYSEIKDHVFGQEPRSLKSGHFSQVIWKGTREMGVAQGKSKSGKIIVVANYNPPGNMIGSFTENVPKPSA